MLLVYSPLCVLRRRLVLVAAPLALPVAVDVWTSGLVLPPGVADGFVIGGAAGHVARL
jgi:hypothetical protein